MKYLLCECVAYKGGELKTPKFIDSIFALFEEDFITYGIEWDEEEETLPAIIPQFEQYIKNHYDTYGSSFCIYIVENYKVVRQVSAKEIIKVLKQDKDAIIERFEYLFYNYA